MSTYQFSTFENLNTLFTTIGNKLKGKLETVNLTQAQYDALTPAQKMNGKAYFITDVVGGINQSCGRNNNYSLNEQEDGTWIDGSKIYKKTFEIPTNSSDNITISMNVSNLSRIIKYEGGLSGSITKDTSDTRNMYVDLNTFNRKGTYDADAWCEVLIEYANNGTIKIYFGNYDTSQGATGYITVWYTKSVS